MGFYEDRNRFFAKVFTLSFDLRSKGLSGGVDQRFQHVRGRKEAKIKSGDESRPFGYKIID